MDLSTFGPWTLFSDIGLISVLLLIGKLIRVKSKLIQKLFIPPSLIAGFLGLILGPNVLSILPFSSFLGTYAGILIALVFSSLALSSSSFSFSAISKRVGPIWAYAQLGMLLQWSIIGILAYFVFSLIWPTLHPAFGVMLPTGFYGGHGTAAAIGNAFDGLGWEDATTLGMTTATVGVVISIIVGLLMVKRATLKGDTSFVKDFKELPQELKSGLVPQEKREASGFSTTSSISIDSLAFHIAFICAIAYLGYQVSNVVKGYSPKLEIPVFSAAFIIGLLLKRVLSKFGVSKYICNIQTNKLGSTFTDLLVAFGVASIKIGIVLKYAVPLLVLLVLGSIITYYITFYLGKKLCKTYWFERSIFAWGWWTGTMAMGIALLRIVDPKSESNAMDDYALAYLPIAPIEIIIITFIPISFASGYGLWFLSAILLFAFLVGFIIKKMGWWIR